MGRWDPKLRGAAYTPDETPDVDDDPPAVHYRDQITRLEQQLQQPPTDPELRARLERDLAHWRLLLDAEQRGEHWRTGEGDRPMF